jgi:hypothetical protein
MAARFASDVISKNDYRTRYLNYNVKKQNKIGAIVNILGGSGAANEASEVIYLQLGAIQVTQAELLALKPQVPPLPPVSTASTLFYNPAIFPLSTVASSNGVFMTDGSSTLYILSPVASTVTFPSPITSLAVDPNGILYVATGSHIFKYSSNTITDMNITNITNVIQFAVSTQFFFLQGGSSSISMAPGSNSAATVIAGSTPGFSDGNGTSAQFKNPQGFALDSENLYIADSGNSLLRKMETTSPYSVLTLAGNSTQFVNPFPTDNVGNRDGSGIHGTSLLYYPRGITVSPYGTFIADTLNNAIRVFINGNLSTYAGVPGTEPVYDISPPGYVDGIASASRWNTPLSISYYNSSLYITEPLNNAVRVLTII